MKLFSRVVMLTLVSFNAMANFGLGPCCSGSPCGIVPCDNTCAGPALLNFGQDFFQGTINVSEQSIQLSLEKANANVQSASFYTALGGRLVAQSLSLIRALDGLVGRYDGAIGVSTDRWRRLSDNVANQIKQSLSSGSFVRRVSTHDQEFNRFSEGASYHRLSERLDNEKDFAKLHGLFSSLYLIALGHVQVEDEARQQNRRGALIDQKVQSINSELMFVPPYSQLNESNVLANFYELTSDSNERVSTRIQAQAKAQWLSKIVPVVDSKVGSLEQDWQALRSAPLIDTSYQQQLALANESGLMRENVLLLQQQVSLLMEINELSHSVDLVQALKH